MEVCLQVEAIVDAQRRQVVAEADRGIAAAVETPVCTDNRVKHVGIEDIQTGRQHRLRHAQETQAGAGVEVGAVALAIAQVAGG